MQMINGGRKMWDRVEQATTNLAVYIITAIGGGFLWLIRTVLTNQRQIALLETEIKHRSQQRDEDREALADVRDSVKRIESKLMRSE